MKTLKAQGGNVHIGVDVSKEKLDVYNPVNGQSQTLANGTDGFRLIRDIARKHKAIVCCEPTGGLEIDLVMFLQRHKVRVAVCDGYKVRHYALATGQFSKNDKIDAKMISMFADNTPVKVMDDRDKKQLELHSKYRLYKTFVDISATFARKACAEQDADMRKMLKAESERNRKKADTILKKCIELIEGDERMRYLFSRFIEIDGVGAVTSIAVIALMPEIGKRNDKAIAKLAGLAPMDRQSGKTQGCKTIHGGRKDLRNALYMAVLPCSRHNHILAPYYKQTKKRIPTKKAAKWAFVPVMRKIITLMNKLAKDPAFRLQKPNSLTA